MILLLILEYITQQHLLVLAYLIISIQIMLKHALHVINHVSLVLEIQIHNVRVAMLHITDKYQEINVLVWMDTFKLIFLPLYVRNVKIFALLV